MQQGWIAVDLRIMVGKPVIRGTRITVELILDQLAAGATVDDIRTSPAQGFWQRLRMRQTLTPLVPLDKYDKYCYDLFTTHCCFKLPVRVQLL